MLISTLFVLAGRLQSMPSDLNGIWVTNEGYAFSVISPQTIWGAIGRKHYSAYGLSKKAENSYEGKYDAGPILRPGYATDPQVAAQYELLTENSPGFPANTLHVPLEIPCVPPPELDKTSQAGVVKVAVGPGAKSLHFSWTLSQGLNDYSGDSARAGGSELIDFNGAYSDPTGRLSISEQGEGPKKTLEGTATLGGQNYKLEGLRVWGRGTFVLTKKDSGEATGRGWIEWDPSTRFCLGMAKAKPQPTDQIMVYIQTTASNFTSAATRMFTRTGQ